VNQKKCENAEMTDEICVASTHTFIVLEYTKVYKKQLLSLFIKNSTYFKRISMSLQRLTLLKAQSTGWGNE
jgi:hypothetical protein